MVAGSTYGTIRPVDLIEELERLRKSRRSVRFDDLHNLLTRAGFERRTGKGDHWVYRHPNVERNLVIDPRTPLLPAYVSKAIRAIEEALNS